MHQDSINWEEIDREYFELWDWIVRECNWAEEHEEGDTSGVTAEYRVKLERFAEICELIEARPEDYYFCWIDLRKDVWYEDIPNKPNLGKEIYGHIVEYYAFLKIDGLCFKQAMGIKLTIDESFHELRVHKDNESNIYKVPTLRTFFFSRTDFRYPHRRLSQVKYFSLFEHVAEIDRFAHSLSAEILASNGNPFSKWKDETTESIERWSPEHIIALEEYFITMAENSSQIWLNRFEAGIDSVPPSAAETYVKSIYKISKLCDTRHTQECVVPTTETNETIPPGLMARKKASYDAYKGGENLEEAGKKIGSEFNGGAPLSAKTIASDAEEYALRENLPLPKRSRGRPSSRLKKP